MFTMFVKSQNFLKMKLAKKKFAPLGEILFHYGPPLSKLLDPPLNPKPVNPKFVISMMEC